MSRYCIECNSSKIVIYARDGDIVCTNCGLVQEERILDDTFYGNIKYDDMDEMHSYYCEVFEEENVNNQVLDIFKRASLNILGEEFQSIIDCALSLYTEYTKGSTLKRGQNKVAIYCTCFLYACQHHHAGVDAKAIYRYFEIPPWLEYSKIGPCLQQILDRTHAHQETNDLLKRMVYTCGRFKNQEAWKIITIAKQLEDKVQCLRSKVKTSKLNACLIYIACVVNGVEWASIETISQIYDVSITTLKKHELLIQSVLKN